MDRRTRILAHALAAWLDAERWRHSSPALAALRLRDARALLVAVGVYKAQRQGSGELWWVLRFRGRRQRVMAKDLSETEARAEVDKLSGKTR